MDKAAIYIRVSTSKQTAKSQLAPCRKFCDEQKYDIVNDYVDEDKSAYHNVRRPAYEEVKRLVKERKIQHIVVWAIDRWCRRGAKELRATLVFLEMYNVKLHSVKENWIEQLQNLPGGIDEIVIPLIYDILGWIAQKESERRSDRVKTSERYQKALDKGKVGRPGIPESVKLKIISLLKEGKSYSYIHDNVTYKAKYGKIKNVSKTTIGEIKQSLSENGYVKKQG